MAPAPNLGKPVTTSTLNRASAMYATRNSPNTPTWICRTKRHGFSPFAR